VRVDVGQTVTYVDVKGGTRRLKCVERVNGTIPWRRVLVGPHRPAHWKQRWRELHSLGARYEDETGYVLQIPDDAWELVKIIGVSGTLPG